jgi:hypothetical protein
MCKKSDMYLINTNDTIENNLKLWNETKEKTVEKFQQRPQKQELTGKLVAK